jgi:hypothetical protein
MNKTKMAGFPLVCLIDFFRVNKPYEEMFVHVTVLTVESPTEMRREREEHLFTDTAFQQPLASLFRRID